MRVNLNLCESCGEKQRTIDRLKHEVQSLRERVHRLERKAGQGPFGSSTSSAKIPVKANTTEQQSSKSSGAKPAHTGHGRQAVEDSDAVPILFQLERARCSRCGKTVPARAPEVLPTSLYGNQHNKMRWDCFVFYADEAPP